MSAADRHYRHMYRGIKLDPYRIFLVYQIEHPAQQHAIKKLLRAGQSMKTLRQDIEESIMTLQRWLEMMDEDGVDAPEPWTEADEQRMEIVGQNGNEGLHYADLASKGE